MTISLAACSKINNETANEVCEKLKEKYGCEFVAEKIGDRLNNDTAKLYLHPADNDKLLFTATIERESREIKDDYYIQLINYYISKTYEDVLTNVGINSSIRCFVVSKEPIQLPATEITAQEFMRINDLDHYTVYMAVNQDGLVSEKLYNGLVEATEKLEIKTLIIGYVFDGDDFSGCKRDIESNPEISTTLIEEHSPVSEFDIIIDNDKCSVTQAQFSESIRGE